MALWEDAEITCFLGVRVYAFGLFCALGAVLALVLLALQCRKKMKDGTAALAGVLALTLGFICSRLLFCLLDQTIAGGVPFKGMFLVAGGGYSMMGVLIGGMLGGMLAARITHQSPLKMADLMAPALMLFAACERLGEGYIADFGISRPLIGEFFKGTFLSVEGEYDWYLATYLLESFSALVLAVILLQDGCRNTRCGNTLLLGMILYGGMQILMESLRYDRHMSFSFVGVQHVMAMGLLGAALILLALRRFREKRMPALAVLALLSIPLVAGCGIALEFALDRTTVNRYLLYSAYILLIALPVTLGIRLRKEA